MTAPVSHADVYTDFQGLASLRAGAREGSDEALREVAGQFEAIFIQMMLKSMRDANLGDSMMDNDHVKTYQSMFDQQISIDLSKRNSLGLADMMVRQLSNNQSDDQSNPTEVQSSLAAQAPAQLTLPQQTFRQTIETEQAASAQAKTATKLTPQDDWRPDSPAAFVKELWPHAQRAAKELGARPEVLIAQAALETGWGKHMIRGLDGSNSFNLFGIKADASWKGDRAVTETVEFKDGLMRKERAAFRAYDSVADSVADYVQFLKSNPRYQDALNSAADAPAFTRELSAAGYATDPDYAGKINRIMDSQRLHDAIGNVDLQGV